MKVLFNADEIRAINEVCDECEHCNKVFYRYCEKTHTDSPVFKNVRCDKIKALFNEDTDA